MYELPRKKQNTRVSIYSFMPQMNGNEACDEIRKIRPGLKVIFTSGHAPDIIRQKAFTEDITNMVYKPVSPRDLLKKVRKVLDNAI